MGAWVHRLSEQDYEQMTAICAYCGPVQGVRKMRGERVGMVCAQARRDARVHETVKRRDRYAYHALARYGLTPEGFAALVVRQSGLCSICDGQLISCHVDHDHSTGVVRGLLCRTCNIGLGHFRDDPALLIAAAAYLTDA